MSIEFSVFDVSMKEGFIRDRSCSPASFNEAQQWRAMLGSVTLMAYNSAPRPDLYNYYTAVWNQFRAPIQPVQ